MVTGVTFWARAMQAIGRSLSPATTSGEASFQMGLELARQSFLDGSPAYCARQVILVHSTLRTIDRYDIFATIAATKQAAVKCNVVSMSGDMFISSRIAAETGGVYNVCATVAELRASLHAHTVPPPCTKDDASNVHMVKWGFPKKTTTAGLCACHLSLCTQGYVLAPSARCISHFRSVVAVSNVCRCLNFAVPHVL